MDEQRSNETRPVNPRRKKRSQLQIFKEAYLPTIIACVALLLILIFVIGSITRGIQRSKYNAQASLEASIAAQEAYELQSAKVDALLKDAAALARHFDYDGAIAMLESFSGDRSQFPDLDEKHNQYTAARESMVLWNDPSQVLSLSMQILVADPERAYNDATYGNSYKQNFITTEEFSKILQQLYENGYILVSLSDITSADGAKELYLPNGKKPLLLTQTNVNYYTYMIDGDGDKLPDKDGAGFASKLILDANGNITCEMVNSDGSTVTGAYDLVPILDSFIETHPEFSYKGAKAILAVSGYDGIFGYRTSPSAQEYFGKAYHTKETEDAIKLVRALKESGYELACYTYENEPYGDYTADQIKNELTKWNEEVVPILGDTDIFVFSRNSDIAEANIAYSGEKFEALKEDGYVYYLGFSEDGERWYSAYKGYIRQGRILITGSNLISHPEWYENIFDASIVLDKARTTAN